MLNLLDRKPRTFALLFFLFTTVLIFSPLFCGRVLIGSSDNLFHFLPNLYFAYDSFWAGEFGLWNKFILFGTNFATSTHNHIYSPLNWLLFLGPRWALPHMLSLRMFCEFWLAGACFFVFIREELKNDRAALLTSTIFQLGGYTFFAVTTYSNLSLLPLVSLCLFVFWTLEKRQLWKSYSCLSILMGLVVLTPNVVYAVAALLVLGAFYFYRAFTENKLWNLSSHFVVGAATLTSTLVGAIRILPFKEGLASSGRLEAAGYAAYFQGEAMNKVYYVLGATVPEVLGVNLSSIGVPLSTAMGLPGAHPQFHGPIYFGLFAFLLFVFSYQFLDEKIRFLRMAVVAVFAWHLGIKPASDFFDLESYPMRHHIMSKSFLAFFSPLFFGHVLLKIDNSRERLWTSYSRNTLFCALAIVGAMCLMVMPFIYDVGFALARIGVPITFILLLVLARSQWHFAPDRFRLRWYCLLIIPILDGYLGFIKWNPLLRETLYWQLFAVLLFLSANQLIGKGENGLKFLFAALFIHGLNMQLRRNGVQMEGREYALTFGFGLLRFSVLSLVAYWALAKYESEKPLFHSRVYILVLFLVLADLVPYNKIFGHQVLEPFVRPEIYGDSVRVVEKMGERAGEKIDRGHYRVNHPLTASGYFAGESMTNLHMIYGLMSYAGANSSFTQEKVDFLKVFRPESRAYSLGMFGADIEDEKFLTMSGCRYDARHAGGVPEVYTRPALSRFSFFSSFEVVPLNEFSKKVHSDWDPLKTLLIHPVQNLALKSKANLPKKLDYKESKSSVIDINFDAPNDGLVLFNDAIDQGWSAIVNGSPAPIIRANSLFMAVQVPQGPARIRFEFMPESFVKGAKVTKIGFLMFLCLTLGLAAFHVLGRRSDAYGSRK